jgi:hypothetical protein
VVRPWPLIAAVLLLLFAVIGLLIQVRSMTEVGASPSPTVMVGTPGGFVVVTEEPSADPTPPPSPNEAPTEAPSSSAPAPPAPATPVPATPAPATPVPTAPLVVAAATPAPAQPATVALAIAGPADSVAAFYAHVVDGSFDRAYALWSERMRATYPRQENLDQRFDETAAIDFQQLYVAEQTDTTATVQANFTETSDAGSSRQFIGYWRLIQVDGRWLLDWPSY